MKRMPSKPINIHGRLSESTKHEPVKKLSANNERAIRTTLSHSDKASVQMKTDVSIDKSKKGKNDEKKMTKKFEEEEETESDEEEEEEEDEEEEEEDEDEQKLLVKLCREGDSRAKIIELSYSTRFDEFLKNVSAKVDIPVKNLCLCYWDEEGDEVEIDSRATFHRLVDSNWPGENEISEDHYLKLLFSDKTNVMDNTLMNNQLLSASYSVARLSPKSGFVSALTSRSYENSFLLGESCKLNLNMTSPTVHIEDGQELKWTKINLLGKGSFGTVYEGITDDGKLVAVKQVEISAEKFEDENDPDVKAFVGEINLMSQLKHKHIVSYYGCQIKETSNGGRIFEIFLELCHGGSLTALRKKFDKKNGKLSVQLARNYIRQILEGLKYLHDHNVIHRDIKGDNVLISTTGDAKLADFGCSKKMATVTCGGGGGDTSEAMYQTMVGTPMFMAPDVLNDTGKGYGSSADVWSVGCLLIELLGRSPWNFQGTNMFQVMFQISKTKDMPTGVPKDCPKALYDFFHHIFERDPDKRASCEELLKSEWMTVDDSELEGI